MNALPHLPILSLPPGVHYGGPKAMHTQALTIFRNKYHETSARHMMIGYVLMKTFCEKKNQQFDRKMGKGYI